MVSKTQKIALLLLLTGFCGQIAFSAEPANTLEKGIIQYQRENYDEALEILKLARDEDPTSTRASYYLGLTHKKLQDYKNAKTYLSEAVEGSPKIREALPELIEVCYQIDDVASAKKWIAVAEEQGLRPGQTAFIKGLVLVKANENQEAIEAFKKARTLEPALKQSSDYQIGLAYLKNESYDEAAKNFQEVVLLDPNTEIGRFADEYKKALDRRRKESKMLRISAGIFEEYDDNVVLKPSDDIASAGISEEEDWREVVTAGVEVSKRFNKAFGGALQYNLYHTVQNELHAFDLSSHTVGAVPSLYLMDHVLSAPVQYNYTFVDGEDYQKVLSINPLANIKIADNQLGQMGVRFEKKRYLQPPANSDEERDGSRWAPGIGWFYFFDQNRAFLNLRYEMDIERTKGPNWDYDGNRFSAAVQKPINDRWRATLAGDIYLQEYDHIHSSFLKKRADQNYGASAMLSYAITPECDWQLRYSYTYHSSNITIYEYERNVVSTGVTARF